MAKLKDMELNTLEEDVINDNLMHVVMTKVTEEIASRYAAEHSDELEKTIQIDNERLKKLVLDKLADMIIGRFMGEVFA